MGSLMNRPTTLLVELQASSGAASSKDPSHPKASSHHCLISSTVATAEGATLEPRSQMLASCGWTKAPAEMNSPKSTRC
ncbi:unnamed protein product [Boreogadus saida]